MTKTSLPLYMTEPAPCPYLEGRMEQKLFTIIGAEDAAAAPQLIERGFRRTQGMFYRQKCPTCTACIGARLRVADFNPSHFARVLKKNAALEWAVEKPVATMELYELFSRYQFTRHTGGPMGEMNYGEFKAMMEDFPDNTRFLIGREEGRAMAVMQIDETPDGTSAVYSFFEPDMPQRSLGTWLILKLAEYTKQTGRPYAYLGLWIKESPKMSYKARFQPLELFIGEKWVEFSEHPSAKGDVTC
ncbi:MAG: arginyltransferase [Alphaproteobacteria bacterium]